MLEWLYSFGMASDNKRASAPGFALVGQQQFVRSRNLDHTGLAVKLARKVSVFLYFASGKLHVFDSFGQDRSR